MEPDRPDGQVRPRRALLSLACKSGLERLMRFLEDRHIEMFSTGGTADALASLGAKVRDLSELTGFSSLMGGRVKSLHPVVYAGILADRGSREHCEELARSGIVPFDLVVSNPYPFESEAVQGSPERAIELIDVGGPSMLRAAAKNHRWVTVLSDPDAYPGFIEEMNANGGTTTLAYRKSRASEAFALTASLDAAIHDYLGGSEDRKFPLRKALPMRLSRELRYGENPHQRAALYRTGNHGSGIAAARHVCGPEPGFNNLADADAAIGLIGEFEESDHACVIVKHGAPCGVAIGNTPGDSLERAWSCDPLSAFGGIVGFSRELDAETATRIDSRFVELVVTPKVSDEAVAILRKRGRVRLLEVGTMADAIPRRAIRSIRGGLLVQDRDDETPDHPSRRDCVTRRAPTEAERRDLEFAWKIVKHARSNAVALAGERALRGIGSGQTSRVEAARSAVGKLQDDRDTGPVVAASDAFFPFPDGLEALASAGITAVIQPGGSKRDGELIETADRHDMAMILTGKRHFSH